MTYLLDTCIISELRKKEKIETSVLEWFENKDSDAFSLSVVTIAEIWNGIELLPRSRKRTLLEDWFYGEILTEFKDKIIPIDERIAMEWGSLDAVFRKKGKPLSVQDLYIAATAKVYGMAIVTINVKDFIHDDITVINPWCL